MTASFYTENKEKKPKKPPPKKTNQKKTPPPRQKKKLVFFLVENDKCSYSHFSSCSKWVTWVLESVFTVEEC